jgi:hypothetical protein
LGKDYAFVGEVEDYPYFLQLYGSELWDAADLAGVERFTTKLLDASRSDIYGRLDRDFNEPRVATLTPAEPATDRRVSRPCDRCHC